MPAETVNLDDAIAAVAADMGVANPRGDHEINSALHHVSLERLQRAAWQATMQDQPGPGAWADEMDKHARAMDFAARAARRYVDDFRAKNNVASPDYKQVRADFAQSGTQPAPDAPQPRAAQAGPTPAPAAPVPADSTVAAAAAEPKPARRNA